MPMAAYIHALLSALHEQHKVRVSDEGQTKQKARAGKPLKSSQRTQADVRIGV